MLLRKSESPAGSGESIPPDSSTSDPLIAPVLPQPEAAAGGSVPDPFLASEGSSTISVEHLSPPHRERKRHRIRYSRPRSPWIGMLIFLIGVEFAMLVALRAHISIAEKDQIALNRSIKEGAVELDLLRSQIGKLREDVAKKVYTRLPNLHPIVFDQVIPVESDQVKNIMFSESGIGEERFTEYRIVLYNTSPIVVRTRIDLMLFNQAGVQVGRARIGGTQDTPFTIVLDPSEVRSYSDKIEIEEEHITPIYFMMRSYPVK